MANKVIDLDRLDRYDSNLKTQANILQRNKAYILNQYVCRGNIFLKCIQAGTTATTTLNLSGVIVGDELTDGTVKWLVIDHFGASGISNWQANKSYAVNDVVIYQNQIYQCNTAHTSTSTFDSTKWNKLGLNQVDEIGIVGKVTWEYTLLANHLALDGSTITNFQATYPELYQFFNTNSLITTVQADYIANKALCYYDSSTDTATMPDFLDKTVWGSNTIVEKKAGLPNIKSNVGFLSIIGVAGGSNSTMSSPPFQASIQGANYRIQTTADNLTSTYGGLIFDASTVNSIYSDSVTTVQPPAIGLIPQIRYKKDSIIDVLEIKENLYTGTSFNTATTTVTTTSSMLNYDFIIIKLAYSDGTNVVMNKSYYIVPVVNEINDFTYFGGTTSYAKITGTITDSTHITFTFLEASTLTDFKVVSIDGVVKGSNQTLATNAQIDALF